MRNIVHLPVFLNSRGLSSAKKLMMVATTTNGDVPYTDGSGKVAFLVPTILALDEVTIGNHCIILQFDGRISCCLFKKMNLMV